MLKISQVPCPKQSKNEVPWEGSVHLMLRNKGNLKEMKWLHEKRCPWSKLTFDCAASLAA